MDAWQVAITTYIALLGISFFPVAKAIAKKVELHPGGSGFNACPHFSHESKKLLNDHYTRINGTLGFWKNQAAMYKAFHHYCLIWTIPSAVVIPVLTPFIVDGNGSKVAVTVISAVTAVLLAFHKGLKIEDNLKAYRHGESEFYDLVRRLLDMPKVFGDDEADQLERYFEEVERVRRFVRNAETDNLGTLDEARGELARRRKLSKRT